MKLIKTYIRPDLLEDVYTALNHEGFCCMTVFEGEGTGSFCDPDSKHGSLKFPAMHSKVALVEIAACEDQVDAIIGLIREHAHTGAKGDGLLFVTTVEQAVRIRDGKTGPEVLRETGIDY